MNENFKIRKFTKSLEKKLQNKLMAPVLILLYAMLYNSKQNKIKIKQDITIRF